MLQKPTLKTLLTIVAFFQAGLFMFAQMPQPDLTFGEGGFVSSEDNLLSDMRILPDGKIMVTGTKPGGTSPNLIVKRLLHNGLTDSSYNSLGEMYSSHPWQSALGPRILSDGRVVLASELIATSTSGVRAYKGNGPDSSFGTNGQASFWGQNDVTFWNSYVDSTDRIFALGTKISFSDLRPLFMTCNKNGQAQAPFESGYGNSDCSTGGDEAQLYAMCSAKNGKMLHAGKAGGWSGPNILFITRNNSDGSCDLSFHNGTAVQFTVSGENLVPRKIGLKQLDNGKILCSAPERLFQLLPNGAMDLQFGEGNGIVAIWDTHSVRINGVHILPDGKILTFGSKNAKPAFQRFYANGKIDSSFAVNGTFELDMMEEIQNVHLKNDTLTASTSSFIVRYFLNTQATGTEGKTTTGAFALYPNPATQRITLSSDQALQRDVSFWNTTGQYFPKTLANDSSSTVDISDLSQGLYYYQAKSLFGEVYKGKIQIVR